MLKFYNIMILCLAIAFQTKAQSNMQIFEKHFVKSNKILFRISPNNKTVFEAMRRGPLKVTRFEVKNESANNEVIIEKMLMPYWEGDTANWLNLIRKDKNKGAFVYQSIFHNKGDDKVSPEKRVGQEKMVFDLLMLSCDLDAEIAKASGLFFIDSLINRNTLYKYKIELYTSPKTTQELISVDVDPSILSTNKKINDLSSKSKNGISTLKWKAVSYNSDYSGYNIERSEDSIKFKRLNKTPVILLTSQFEKNKAFIEYKDTMQKTNKKYYYRVKGINFFGEESEPSNVVTNYNYPIINSNPLIDSLTVIQNKQIKIVWRMENKTETNYIKNYLLKRSEKDNGNYTTIFESTKALKFLDLEPLQTNFYKVAAITFNGDTLLSYSRMALIIDTIAPLSPKNLTASVDKKGNVLLKWNRSKEGDLQGYKLFKANDRREEFVQINNKFIKDTFYNEKLNLNTLSRKIYYSISAVDDNYNCSTNSLPIEVKRTDTIPPQAPILRTITSELSGVKLNFILSNSEDLSYHKIYRREGNNMDYLEMRILKLNDSLSNFTDTTAQYGETYTYLIKAFDEDNNQASSKKLTTLYETGYRKKLTDVNYLVDRTKKNIILFWSYTEKEVEKYILYRAKENEALSIIKTVDGNTLQYTDNYLNIGNLYEYRIKAVLYNGTESVISNPIKVTY